MTTIVDDPVARRERIVQVATEIQRDRGALAEVRARLRAKETELELLLGLTPKPERSLVGHLAATLDAQPERPFTAEELHVTCGPGAKLPTVRSTLARMVDEGKIVRAGRGRYRGKGGP